MRSRIAITMLLTVLTALPLAAQDDPVMKAMRDELARSMQGLQLPDGPKPYFIAYRVDQIEENSIGATLGSLLSSRPQKVRMIGVELRVGSPALDNTNFMSLSSAVGMPSRMASAFHTAPLDDDYAEVRRQLWRATDNEYKAAVESFAGKRAVLENRKQSEPVPDFSAEPPATWNEPYPAEKREVEAVQQLVRELSAGFRQYPELFTSSVEVTVHNLYTRYVNSEGTVFTRWEPQLKLSLKAESQAADGMPLADSYEVYARSVAELPAKNELMAHVEETAKRLRRLHDAKKIERYNGPVLFEGTAAAAAFASVFAPALVAVRQPLSDNPQFEMFFERLLGQSGGSLADRIGGRVLPSGFSLSDDPTSAQFNAVKLPVTIHIDDDGVLTRKLTLVDKGVLKTLLSTRTPVPAVSKSTGSRRGWGAAPTNLQLSVEKGMIAAELRQELLRLAKQRGNDFGIVVRRVGRGKLSDSFMEMATRMSGRESSGSESILEVYKLYADGREELVRGTQIDGLTLSSFREIVAAGSQPAVLSDEFMPKIGGAFFTGMSAGAAAGLPVVSYAVPSLLFEELSLKPAPGPFPALPASKPPLLATTAP